MVARHYYQPDQPLALSRPEDLYKAWLSGQSLRSLGKAIGCSHNTCAAVLKRKYGPMATNLTARSLERTLIQDHGLKQVAYAFQIATEFPEGDGTRHRSQHNLNQLTAYQSSGRDHVIESVASLAAYDTAVEDTELEDPLRLPLVVKVLTAAKSIIGSLWGSEVALS